MTVMDDGLALQVNQVGNQQARLQSNNSINTNYKPISPTNSAAKIAQYETLKIKAHPIP